MMLANVWCLLLLLTSSAFSARVQQRAMQNATAGSGLQVGAMVSERYELMSLLKSTDWPSTSFPGFKKISFLGKGAFGETWLAYDHARNQNVAIKFFYRKEGPRIVLLNLQKANQQERKELATASVECDAPTNIINGKSFEAGKTRFAECFENKVKDPSYAHLVMQVAGSQTLEEYLKPKPHLPSATILRIAKMMLEGLVQMEGKYVHRDIKPANVMLYTGDDGELYLRFIDFGLVVTNGAKSGVAGTPMFLPPEMWPVVPASAVMTSAFDVYSTGETLYSLMCGKTFHEAIFNKYGQHQNEQQIKSRLVNERPEGFCNPKDSRDDRLAALFELVVKGMMNADATRRSSPTKLLSSAIFEGIETLKVEKPQQSLLPDIVQKPKPQPVIVPVIEKPQVPSFLDQCHDSKQFWFANAPACCLQERYDPLRQAICERPCGPDVPYVHGQCQNNCRVTSSRQLTFDTSQYCCVDLAWPSPKCIYRDNLPQGDGWGWQRQNALLPDINAKKSPFAPQQVQQVGGYNPRFHDQRPAQRERSPQPERRYNPMQQYAPRDYSPQPRRDEKPFHLPQIKQHNVMYNFGNQQQRRNNYWGV
jgi:serine/threonine protein kinase